MARWYRFGRLAGIAAMTLGGLVLALSFPYVASDPASFAESAEPDPTWATILSRISIVLVGVGLGLYLLPLVHEMRRRR
jgi:lipopolysaccharide export LptBFGC system permease protein LptF